METREEKFSFIARMPDRPDALRQAAAIVTEHCGNINRIQYSRRIDPRTVFFEVTAHKKAHAAIRQRLAAIGYLQTTLPDPGILRFHVRLPHTPGALAAFLDLTTKAQATIALIDFDDAGPHPDQVTVSVSLDENGQAETLLDALKSRYPLEILEYDTTGNSLDETVFYLCFAQQVRALIGPASDGFLLHLLHDINHVVQDLGSRGEEPHAVFASVLQTGTSLQRTCGEGFYADVQQVTVTPEMDLFCFQLPGGGNVYLLNTPEESMMIDTGYGIYYPDIIRMLNHYGLGNGTRPGKILLTHADADHCGAAGYYEAPAMMHPTSAAVIETSNRAFASPAEGSVLEMVYTTIINLFSRFNPPEDYTLFGSPTGESRGIFPVLHRFTFGGVEFEVLEGFGGHMQGMIYLFCQTCGLLFTSDTVINFGSLTEERKTYSSLADFLVTSVNVDSATARRERHALMEIAAENDRALAEKGRRCYICGGHGAVSVLDANRRLEAFGQVERYTHQG